MTPFKTKEELEAYYTSPEFLAKEKRRQEITSELVAGGTPFITAAVIAGDILSAEDADERIKNGEDPMEVYHRIGSYARFEWCVKNMPQDKLLQLLPELWVAADPNDSNSEYLKLWYQAYSANGHQTILDNERKCLPKGNLQVYRGQIGDAIGISWTLDLEVAKRFALTGGGRQPVPGGGRQPVPGGKVFKANVNAKHVLAYLTERGESELIIDLKHLRNGHVSHTVMQK